MKTGLAHVCIETDDLDSTERFYAVLGLKRRFEFRNQKNELVGFYLAFENQTFIEVIKNLDIAGQGRIKHFALETDSVDKVHAALQSQGYDASPKELAGDQNWMITCHDPNGIFIEIQQYTKSCMQLIGGTCKVDYEP